MEHRIIKVYTDGSCHTKFNIGAWAAILMIDEEKIVLSGVEYDTTNNRMEISAVIKAIEYVDNVFLNFSIIVFTDSQYVQRIPERMEKLKKNKFITKKRNTLPNHDLVAILIRQIETHVVDFVKVKAHQRNDIEIEEMVIYNNEVDKLARQLVRIAVMR